MRQCAFSLQFHVRYGEEYVLECEKQDNIIESFRFLKVSGPRVIIIRT